jgi:peptide/nickel transport system substrate-binding protein
VNKLACAENISTGQRTCLFLLVAAALVLAGARAASPTPQDSATSEEFMRSTAPEGTLGGRLVFALRSEPKTFNPVLAVDGSSKEILGLMVADLIHINRLSQGTEPALATSWKISPDGRRYVLQLRHGVKFSDGYPFTADDVVFSFQVYLDEKVNSPQRDLLIVGDKPIAVRKLAEDQVEFSMSEPYAAAERLFDSVAILPRHLLESAYLAGKLGDAWGTTVAPNQIAGLGPFRLKEYLPGQRVVLERNPYYWKTDSQGKRLPYLDEIAYQFVASEDAEVLRFQSGETDVLSRFSAQNYGLLDAKKGAGGYRIFDLGPGLEYNFLFFNLNDPSSDQPADIARKKIWFSDVRFRQAVSLALDRDAMVRLVFERRATPIWGNVTPGNKRWMDQTLPHPPRSVEQARQLLAATGFSWKSDGTLQDSTGQPVGFSILTSSSNAQRLQMATMIQQDLSQLGMHVDVVSMEFRSMVDRVFNTFNYEACLLSLGTGDTDPTAEMNVWTSDGSTHVWHLGEPKPATPWEAEVDELMRKQEVSLDYAERKKIYDQVQELVSQNVPVIFLASPNILLAAKNSIGNFEPAILAPYADWNAEELFVRKGPAGGSR